MGFTILSKYFSNYVTAVHSSKAPLMLAELSSANIRGVFDEWAAVTWSSHTEPAKLAAIVIIAMQESNGNLH